MKSPLGDIVRLKHILIAISEVNVYLKDVEYDQFTQNSEKRFATVKQIEIIGEACNALTPELKDAYPEIPWKPIKGFRNISIHEYFSVNFRLVWDIAKHDLPELKSKLTVLLNDLEQ